MRVFPLFFMLFKWWDLGSFFVATSADPVRALRGSFVVNKYITITGAEDRAGVGGVSSFFQLSFSFCPNK